MSGNMPFRNAEQLEALRESTRYGDMDVVEKLVAAGAGVNFLCFPCIQSELHGIFAE